ncbi:hypothetical protein HX945_005292, partial [Salmonella enterica]|nr:hypothetical protein [Salmonella enterica]
MTTAIINAGIAHCSTLVRVSSQAYASAFCECGVPGVFGIFLCRVKCNGSVSRFLKGDELGAEFGVFFNELFDGVSGDGVRLRHYRDKKIIVASHC